MAGQKGGAKKIGRSKQKCQRYYNSKIKERYKIVKIAQSSGLKPALEYATKCGLSDFARTRLREFNKFAVQL